MKNKVVEIVVARILSELAKGVVPWHMPWIVLPRQNLTTRKPYRGFNRFLLQNVGEDFFLTFLQAKQKGGSVKKGSTAWPVIFWSKVERKQKASGAAKEGEDGQDDAGATKDDKDYSFILKYYNVFRLRDIDGIERPQLSTPKPVNESIEAFIQATGAAITNAGSAACYKPGIDAIETPVMSRFESQAHYYNTLFHELVHWTGGAGRLNRHKKDDFFGQDEYSKEELVAEIGAAMLCHTYGIELIPHSAAYVENWLKALNDDKSMIITAASRAEKALEYLGVFKAEDNKAVNAA